MSRPSFGGRFAADAPVTSPQHDRSGEFAAGSPNLNSEVAAADDLAARFLNTSRAPADAPQEADLPAAPSTGPGAARAVLRPSFGTPRGAAEPAPKEAQSQKAMAGELSLELDDAFSLAPRPSPKAGAVNQAQQDDGSEAPPVPVYQSSGSPFGKKGALTSAAVRALRADIKAASIVTDLVSAMAIHPGSDTDVAIKSKLLTSLLVAARRSAGDLIEMVDPERSDVGWVKAQALGQTASMLATEWTRGHLDEVEVRRRLDLRMDLVRSILSDRGGEIELALADCFEGTLYKACSDAQSASDHRAVAIHQAAWTFSEAVCSVQDEAGTVFSFGLPEGEVVSALLQQTTSVVTASRPDIRDAEAATTWMRGAMRRASRLVAAEYSNKAREACAAQEVSKDATAQSVQMKAAARQFTDAVLPFIAQWAVKNFQSIERASRKLIEESQDEQERTDRPGH